MLPTFQVENAVSASEILAERLPKTLPAQAKRVYQALLIPALENARERSYVNPSRVTFHCPAEIISMALGISRMTLWRAVQVLKAAGLIDNRPVKGNCRGQVRNTGSVWQVRLTPNHGSRCKLSYEELKHSWRPNFNDEIRRGKSSYRALVTYRRTSNELDIDLLRKWSVDSFKHSNPVDTSVCNKPKNAVLEALLDVSSARPGRDTVARVDLAAQALATALADARSLQFYRLIVWNALKASQRGVDLFQVLYQVAIRARVDVRENWSRKGGAVFTSRLKQTEFWDELMRC
jgi:DNA-binding Lrp family transcriptional regulator